MVAKMKINFGCGSNIIPGWRNLDIDRPNQEDRIDITRPVPFKDNSVDFILGEHICEHVSAPDCFRFFLESHRILKPGGVLRVCVPILDRIQDPTHCIDLILGHGHMVVFNLANLVTMLQLAGFETVAETGRKDCDGHHRVIGIAKDDLETLRVEATKAK